MERIQKISSHVTANGTDIFADRGENHADDVVICSALRTCLSKANKGPLKDTAPETMLKEVVKAIIDQTKVDPKLIDDFIIGNVLMEGAGAGHMRMAELLAGIPNSSSAMAINRLCSSGIESVSILAAKIKSGIVDVGICGGVESMSKWGLPQGRYPKMSNEAMQNEFVKKTYTPDGMSSENVSEMYGQTRSELDTFAVNSHLKAADAQKKGLFKDEIVPFKTTVLDKDGNETIVMADTDNGIRADSNEKALKKLKPAFKKIGGLTTGANSSQLTDGAACVLMARRSVAEKHGLPILAKFIGYSTAGVPPEIMGVGPAYCIPKCLQKSGLTVDDIDIFEINEAFASQAKWCAEFLKIDSMKLNPKGGAIALGHPLAATGARMLCTLLPELKRTKGKYGVISMCIGTGMGACA